MVERKGLSGFARPGRSWRSAPLAAAGYSIIELLVTVAVISLLASISIPLYENFSMRTRRTEAYKGLSGIYKAQSAYFATYSRYSPSFDDLGFELEGGTRVDANTIQGRDYRFEMLAYEFNGRPNGNFWATATADLHRGDGIRDVLLIENSIIVKD